MQILLGHGRDQTCQGSRRLRLHNNGVFSLDEGSKTRYVFSSGQFASSCPTGYGPRGFQVRVSLKGPQRCDLFVWSKDYGWTHITDSKPTSRD